MQVDQADIGVRIAVLVVEWVMVLLAWKTVMTVMKLSRRCSAMKTWLLLVLGIREELHHRAVGFLVALEHRAVVQVELGAFGLHELVAALQTACG